MVVEIQCVACRFDRFKKKGEARSCIETWVATRCGETEPSTFVCSDGWMRGF